MVPTIQACVHKRLLALQYTHHFLPASSVALWYVNLYLAQGHGQHNPLVFAGQQTQRPELRYVAYMNIVPPKFSDLFSQLGLPSDEVSIKNFIRAHPLPENVPLDEGRCWTPAQARLLRESLAQDADWALMVDRLNVAMHKLND